MNALPIAHVRRLRTATVAAAAALTVLVPALAAQDDDGPHPAHIHSGTCAELGDVVVPLEPVAAITGGETSGHESAQPVKAGETIVEMPLQEIVDGGYAINVHLSDEEIDTYIACGDIGGVVREGADGQRELFIGLGELNESGHTGVAWLGDDGDTTEVVVMLVEPDVMETGAGASQSASPESDAAAESLAVEIKSFTYNPGEITVPAGGSVTWTNQDNAPHTATAIDRNVLQSGAITFGESYTQVFETPGSYEYFCEYHPNMKGTIVVE